ncbi:putative defense protein 3 [Agrilus planipennis]|uniref:Defense protein 3 n=1 Tax=Agrilus planipennis TaxID=224129 RepID=A0A1W4XN39_AGRPL|nr:putative defense protein 3 [Agrilus planipennis]
MLRYFSVLLIFSVECVRLSSGFPDGAPVDVCVKPKPNRPNHSGAKPQPADTNPYTVTASDSYYRPGTQITVTIAGREYFKGFFIQARDARTNEWIGDWIETPNAKRHPECSSITHADPKLKQQATLLWQAPKNAGSGQVYFTGTVLRDYSTFWSEIVAEVA